jgi:hypothetical protein
MIQEVQFPVRIGSLFGSGLVAQHGRTWIRASSPDGLWRNRRLGTGEKENQMGLRKVIRRNCQALRKKSGSGLSWGINLDLIEIFV